MLWLDILFTILFILVIVSTGTLIVKALSYIAAFLKLTGFVVGFIMMAFATSIPELFVGITSALAKTPALSLGNVIGANIIDLTLVIGIAIILSRGITIESAKTKVDSLYMFAIASIAMVLTFIGQGLSRIDGVILIVVFIIYSSHLIKEGRVFTKEFENHANRGVLVSSILFFLIAIAVLFFSSQQVVSLAGSISLQMGVPPILTGLLLVSLATTLPELTFTIRAVNLGHPSLAIGDLIGSVVVNSTLVLGIVALIHPIQAHFLTFMVSACFMITIAFIFSTYTSLTNKLDWRIGLSFIFLYILFLMTEIYLRTVA